MPKPVICQVTAQGRALASRVVACEIRQAGAAHVLVILDMAVPSGRGQQILAEKAPVVLRWGQAPDAVETFYGYVHHHQSLSAQRGDVKTGGIIRYVLIGTSMPMNSQRTRSWRGVSGSYLARTLAKEHGLRSVVHTSPRQYDYLAQNGISDFALLKQLGTDSGFDVWVNGSTLWFTNPEVLLSAPKALSVPTFTMSNSAVVADTLLGLEIVNGQTVIDGGVKARRTAYGYDPRSKRFFKSTSGSADAYLDQIVQGSPVESLAEAQTVLSAANASARNWVTGKALVAGTPRLRPGSLVNLQGDGVLNDYKGYWLVTGATHSLLQQDRSLTGTGYTTTLELGRDQIGALTFKDSQALSPSVENMACRLTQDGVWQSALLEETNAG